MENCCQDPKSPEFKAQLRQRLTPLQYSVTQEKGTERAFTNKYYKWKEEGVYRCIVCSKDLFLSQTKYDTGSGWPAFYDVIDEKRVRFTQDASHVGANLLLLIRNPGLVRTEVSCSSCGAHLGHLFHDGPKPTGKRYCINSSSLEFQTIDSNGNANKDLNYSSGCSHTISGCSDSIQTTNAKINGTA